MTQPDAALETAADLLDDTVCDCGCLDTEHAVIACDDQGGAVLGECRNAGCEANVPCASFRPVTFHVIRALPLTLTTTQDTE
jgi:hypothetical protein